MYNIYLLKKDVLMERLFLTNIYYRITLDKVRNAIQD